MAITSAEIDNAGERYRSEIPMESIITIFVFRYDMCRRRKGGRCTKGTAGTFARFLRTFGGVGWAKGCIDFGLMCVHTM